MADQAKLIAEDAGSNLGITLPLSAELAGRLRQHEPPTLQEAPKLTFLSKKSPGDDSSDDESDEEAAPTVPFGLLNNEDPLDDWNEVLPGVVEPETSNENEEEKEHDKPNEEAEKEDDNTSDDEWSVSPDPPPHMPVVVVNLKRLVGYVPNSAEETEQLEHQIHAALWYGSADAAACKTGGNPQEDNMEQVLDAAQHFDERVTELMQSAVGRHSTTQQEALPHQVVVSYPEFLCCPRDSRAQDGDFAPRKVLATQRIWKRLLKPHPIPVVASLLQHLQKCHQSLVWKYQMHRELVGLAGSEDQARTRRHQSKALREWKTVKREHQLEQLYQVRETLEWRRELAVSKVQELEGLRDQAVAGEIRRRRVETTGFIGGLEALDLNSTILAFPEAQSWLGLAEEEDGHHEDQIGPSFVSEDEEDEYQSDGSGYDAEGDVEDDASNPGNSPVEATTADADPNISAMPRRDNKARRAKVAKKRRRRLEEAAKEAEHQSKLEQARGEEAKVRDLCTTTDLKMAQAILAALEKKLESVDELLESLQEEAWADEEAHEKGQALVPGAEEPLHGKDKKEAGLTLLDQVLAMILGSFPPPIASENEDASKLLENHTQKLQAEHSRIVKEWKEHFGRLPSSLLQPEAIESEKEPVRTDGDRQSELRTAYGIEENEKEDWDDVDSDNGDAKNERPTSISRGPEEAPARSPAPKPQRVGLRPGGKTKVGLRPGGKARN